MFVCMHVCLCVCVICVRVSTCTCVFIIMRICICVCIHMHFCVNALLHTCTCTIPSAGFPHFLDVGEYDVVLPLGQDPPPLGQCGGHSRVVHEVLYQDIEATEVGGFGGDHLKQGLEGKKKEKGMKKR